MPDDHAHPLPRQVVLVAVLAALLALLVAWQADVPVRPASLDPASFAVGLVATAILGVILHGTGPGNGVRWFLANTSWGQFLVLAVAVLLLVFFSRVDDITYAVELASAILGASIGSLARLAVIES